VIRVLLVEDDSSISEALVDAVRNAGIELSWYVVTNRQDAARVVTEPEGFDLAICDLRIPSESGFLDSHVDYGREILATIRAKHPGTPVCVFSAYADEEFLEKLVLTQTTGDPFGRGSKEPMVKPFRKSKLVDLVTEVCRCASEVIQLDAIEISTYGINLDLSEDQARLLKIATRRLGGTVCKVRELNKGLSGNRVVLLSVIDRFGAQPSQCVIKVGERLNLEDEAARYHTHVPAALPARCFAPIFETYTEGVGRSVALAYSLAFRDPESLASVLQRDTPLAAEVVKKLSEIETGWLAGRHAEQVSVRQVCSLLAGDVDPVEVLRSTDPELATQLSTKEIQITRSVQHGDLHLENVLVGPDGEPVLIDYGRTEQRIASFDPVSLELSLIFHPSGRAVCADWPTIEQVRNFDDLETYLTGCPVSGFVRQCREWAFSVGSDNEVYSCFLAYSVRQLQFPDTDKHLARECLKRAATKICS
jgi:CheY-like chemotaxis protein